MSDSKQGTDGKVEQQPKTFTQRFQEMETSLGQLQYVVQFHGNIFESLMKKLEGYHEQIQALRETVTAVMRLGDDGQPVNTGTLVTKITQLKADNYRAGIEADEKNGRLKAITSVADENTLVSFSTTDVVYGYNTVKQFQDETVRAQLLKGSKAGDVISDMTIVGLYEIVAQVPATPTEVNNEGSQTLQ